MGCWLAMAIVIGTIAFLLLSCQRNDVGRVAISDADTATGPMVIVRVETSNADLPGQPDDRAVPRTRHAGPETLTFEREGNDTCWRWHHFTIDFPPPGAPPNYLAFTLPAGRYYAKETLRASDDGSTHAPTFHVGGNEVVYLGRLILQPSGDITQVPEVLPPAVRAGSTATQIFGFGPRARSYLCGP